MKNYSAHFNVEKIIALPISVETNAILLEWDEVLWVFINTVENKETFVYKVNTSLEIEKITTLPLLSTSAITSEKNIFISGADAEGNLKIIAIDDSGKIQWENSLKIVPIIWPVMAYNGKIFIAWQEKISEIERGYLSLETKKIEKLTTILVENPPAILFPLEKTILATISESNKISIVDLLNEKKIAENVLHQLTIGKLEEGIFYGWQEGNKICIKHQNNKESDCIPVKNASLGNLKAISGNEATFWLQNKEMTVDGDYQWKSTIIQKNTDLFEIEGFVYSVVSWEKRFAAIKNSKLILFKK